MIKIYTYFFLLFALLSCATPNTPQGGPSDITPPKVISYTPQQLTTNFQEKSISIQFNEWIQIANLKQQLIISPPIFPEPVFTARKNELKIQLKDKLKDSTTYSIYFGDAIKDNNEGNVISNLNYVFSTGDDIDSMYIAGKVMTLDGSEVPQNTFVQLYTNLQDSIITKERPQYLYKVKEDGTFKINYLPHDTFKLFVLNDLNTNYQYDLPTEWVGKIDTPIILSEPHENIQLPIILPEAKDFKLKDFNSTLSSNILTVELNKELNPSIDSIFLLNFESQKVLPLNNILSSKYFHFYISSDSLSIRSKLIINNISIDSFTLKQPSKHVLNAILLPKVQGEFKYSILNAYDNEYYELFSFLPIKDINKNKIRLISGDDTLKVENISLADNNTFIKIQHPLKESFKGKLFLPDSSILYANEKYADSISFEIEYTSQDDYGKMDFEIYLPSADSSYILRIFNNENMMYHEEIVSEDTLITYSFPYLLSGEYFVEVIEDVNKSGTWNGASFWESRPPEKVFRSPSYTVRPNWEDIHIVKVIFEKQIAPTPLVNSMKYLEGLSKKSSKPSVRKSGPTTINEGLEVIPKSGSLPDFKKN